MVLWMFLRRHHARRLWRSSSNYKTEGSLAAWEHRSDSRVDPITLICSSTMTGKLIYALFSTLAGVALVNGHHLEGMSTHWGVPQFSLYKIHGC